MEPEMGQTPASLYLLCKLAEQRYYQCTATGLRLGGSVAGCSQAAMVQAAIMHEKDSWKPSFSLCSEVLD